MSEFYRQKAEPYQEQLRNQLYVPEVPRIFHNEGIIYSAQKENDPITQIIPFKEWSKDKSLVLPGTVITDIHPRELFTSQDWLRPEKWVRAVEAQELNNEDAFTATGVIFHHPKEHVGNVPVILEGNHRAVRALQKGYKLTFQIIEKELPEDTKVWRLTNLLNKYGGGLDRDE